MQNRVRDVGERPAARRWMWADSSPQKGYDWMWVQYDEMAQKYLVPALAAAIDLIKLGRALPDGGESVADFLRDPPKEWVTLHQKLLCFRHHVCIPVAVTSGHRAAIHKAAALAHSLSMECDSRSCEARSRRLSRWSEACGRAVREPTPGQPSVSRGRRAGRASRFCSLGTHFAKCSVRLDRSRATWAPNYRFQTSTWTRRIVFCQFGCRPASWRQMCTSTGSVPTRHLS